MEKEPYRAFQYHASLPYATETNAEALSDLDRIVARIEALYDTGAFNGSYVFGTAYSHEVGQATRDLMVWMKRKLDLPLTTRIKLTRIYVGACFEASEAALITRYGLAACTLWKSSSASRLLPEQKGLVRWDYMIRAVKKLVLNRHSESSSNLNDRDSPSGVIMSMAILFRSTVELNQYDDELFADILSYLSPTNDRLNALVLTAFGALIPFEDPAAAKYQRLLFSLWSLVPSEVATRSILPSVAQFTKVTTLRGWTTPKLTDSQLDVCFQGTLHSLNIPLISLSQSKAKERHDQNRRSRMKSDVIGLNSSAFAQIVVWSLRKDDQRALDLLSTMVNTLQSFCHPSNLGPWTALIITMLADLANTFILRMNTEEELEVPQVNRLSSDAVARFASILIEPMLLGVHSHAPIVFGTAVNLCRVLAILAPDMVLPRILSEAYPTLRQGLHQPHRIIAVLTCISRAAVPLTAHAKYRMHLTTLLELALPSIDANEVRRCMLALTLFQTVAAVVSFEDKSDDDSVSTTAQVLPEIVHELEEGGYPELDPDLYETVDRGASAAFPEILTQYMRRIFDLLETTGESSLGSAASASVMRVLLACSPQIFDKLLQMTLVEMLNPQQQANDAFAQVCGAFIRADCNTAFPQFWSLLTRYIREEINENQAGSGRSVMARDRALLRYLSVLNMCLLAANSESLVNIASELSDLISLLREVTHTSVVYTVANTIHHAIAALVGYSIVLPSPNGFEEIDSNGNCDMLMLKDSGKLRDLAAIKQTGYRNIPWNIPTENSKKLAVQIYQDQIEFSFKHVQNALKQGDSTVQTRDVISSALIFVRTSSGAIAPLAEHSDVIVCRERVARFLLDLYPHLGHDDIASLKEVLFVAKVWLCDVGYERTARIDSHQDSLYKYEKSAFKVPGCRKRYPPTVLARRAQLYHHQRQALATQRRSPTSLDKEILNNILIDACFSAYPAVRRNAFSALYSPLKIFADYDLYADIYRSVLDMIEELIAKKDYERAEGGFALLSYRSMSMHTVCHDYTQLLRYFTLVSAAVATDDFKLSGHAATVFWLHSNNSFRLAVSRDPSATEVWKYISSFISYLIQDPLESLHWNQALLRTSSLMFLSQNLRMPIDPVVFNRFAEGTVGRNIHPDVRYVSLQGLLLLSQHAFRKILSDSNYEAFRVNGPEDIPVDAYKSTNDTELKNDWSFFMDGAHTIESKSPKIPPKLRVSSGAVGTQGWLLQPEGGLWRVPRTEQFRNRINEADNAIFLKALKFNTLSFWSDLAGIRQIEPRQDEDRLDKLVALLYRDLTVFSSMGYGIPLDSLLQDLPVLRVTNDQIGDRNWHRVASEVVCGLLLALPLLGDSEVEMILDRVSSLLIAVLDVIASETIEYWISSMTLVVSSVDLRRYNRVLTLLEELARPETSGNGGGIRLALRTTLYTEVLAVVSWRMPRLAEISKLWLGWNHELQATRESASNGLAVAASGALKRVWSSIADATKLANAEKSGLGQQPIRLDDDSIQHLSKCFELDTSKIDLSLLSLSRRSLQLMGPNASIGLAPLSLEVLLRTTGVRDDPETLVLVTALFSTLDTAVYHPTAVDQLAVMLSDGARSEQWHQRIRMLLLCQSFFFNHLLVFSAQRREMFAYLAVDSLSDSQVEVRELAADTLSGIVRCSPVTEQQLYIQKLGRKFELILVHRLSSLADRHAAVLGLGALIGAFPYVSPPPLWLPQMLATLAIRAASDSGLVGKSAKQILGDFKKTRQDTWHIDQKVFTQEQLDDLEGVLWKNYFA